MKIGTRGKERIYRNKISMIFNDVTKPICFKNMSIIKKIFYVVDSHNHRIRSSTNRWIQLFLEEKININSFFRKSLRKYKQIANHFMYRSYVLFFSSPAYLIWMWDKIPNKNKDSSSRSNQVLRIFDTSKLNFVEMPVEINEDC